MIVEAPGRGDEDLRIVRGRVEVQVTHDLLGHMLHIVVDEGEQPEPCQQDDEAFGRFGRRDEPRASMPRRNGGSFTGTTGSAAPHSLREPLPKRRRAFLADADFGLGARREFEREPALAAGTEAHDGLRRHRYCRLTRKKRAGSSPASSSASGVSSR